MDRQWLQRSLFTQGVLAVYFQAVIWFPLGALNDQIGAHNRPLVEQFRAGTASFGDAVFAFAFILPTVLFLVGYVKRIRVLMWLSLLGYTVWLALQIQTWWVNYIFGASENWQRVYHRVFSRTLKILPSFGTHLAPDAMHLLIQIILLVAIIFGVVGLMKHEPAKKMKAGAYVDTSGGQ